MDSTIGFWLLQLPAATITLHSWREGVSERDGERERETQFVHAWMCVSETQRKRRAV